MLEIETIAILGAGRDAVRVALLCSLAGLDVRIGDEAEEALDGAFHALRADVETALGEGRIDPAQRQRILDGILFTPELDEAAIGADLLFAAGALPAEAARTILTRMAPSCRATALLATRLDPAEIASAVPQPGRVVGLALAPGDDLFPRVSLRPGPATTPHARARGEELAERLNRASGLRETA